MGSDSRNRAVLPIGHRKQVDRLFSGVFSGTLFLATVIMTILSTSMLCRSQAPATINTLAAVRALDNTQAARGVPVDFEAFVVFSRGDENLLFVQDGNAAIFVRPPDHTTFQPGDRVRVKGRTQNSFRPIVIGESVTLLRHEALPKPEPADFTQLIRGDIDCHLVSVRGVVRSADVVVTPGAAPRTARMQLVTDGGHFEVDIDSADQPALKSLLDADVEITGAAAGKFNDKMQITGVVLYVHRLDDIRVLHRAAAAPLVLPITPMDQILDNYRVSDLSPRVRVHGTITYYQPGSAVVLQDGNLSLWIATRTREPLEVGDQADASGFPDEHDRILSLKEGSIVDNHIPGVVTPVSASWDQLSFWSNNQPTGHQNDLVSISGRVVTEVREPLQDELVLDSGGRVFSAILHHPANVELPPLVEFPQGSTVRVTGICNIVDLNSINPPGNVPFEILLRTFGDIQLTAGPPLLNTRNLIIVAGLLLLFTILAIAHGWRLERRVHGQAESMAQLEQRRSLILESINSAGPLAEILEQISALVSSTLRNASCWVEIADGARIGQLPKHPDSLRVISRAIAGHAGNPLGILFAALPPNSPSWPDEAPALEMGARLAVLAIETHRLYADLTYRSEFDALTDAHNRFSLDRFLDEQIRKARSNASIFGLIYLDLDQFKQVNDVYGHHAGDQFLREISHRLKRQLRPGDMLARLGGDEFAILVPKVRTRADVEEIARRLESCFQAPVIVEGRSLSGSASLGIAVYPEDGATDDELLSAADAAMYAVKKNKEVRAER